MTEIEVHRLLTWSEILFAAITLILLSCIVAPYGRHQRGGFGPSIPNHIGWIMMELPSLAVFIPVYLAGENAFNRAPLLLFALFQSHYLYRTLVYPFRLKTKTKSVALVIVVLGALFNSLNAYINGRELSHFGHYGKDWLGDPRFIGGTLLFLLGYFINHQADKVLMNLRQPGETGYKIPYGGLYRYVSCPNYLGEIIEWVGFAIACWSLPALAFALYAAANVGPRALAHHRWYQEKFADYPSERHALLPFVL